MAPPAFAVAALPNIARPAAVVTSSFAPRPAAPVARRALRASLRMGNDPSDYVIQTAECDPSGEQDDGGDGFIGRSEMDDYIGIEMPEDLASYEKNAIANAESYEDMVDQLKVIKRRRMNVLDERRAGMGLDNVGNYLDAL
jgi:hypothetical protein